MPQFCNACLTDTVLCVIFRVKNTQLPPLEDLGEKRMSPPGVSALEFSAVIHIMYICTYVSCMYVCMYVRICTFIR